MMGQECFISVHNFIVIGIAEVDNICLIVVFKNYLFRINQKKRIINFTFISLQKKMQICMQVLGIINI